MPALRLDAISWLRAMADGESGGSEPHLFETTAGAFMVKTANNPQGARVLLNELLGGLCLDWLGVSHPATAVVDVPDSLITNSPGAVFRNGQPLAAGLAFGSGFIQSDPQGTVDVALIDNRNDIAGTLVYDTWVPNGDSRQFRVKRSDEDVRRYQFIPIDQGHSFGHNWTIESLGAFPVPPTAPDTIVPLREPDVAGFVTRLRQFTSDDATSLLEQVPPGWASDEEHRALSEFLVRRAASAADAVESKFAAES